MTTATDLGELGTQLLDQAETAHAGRAAATVHAAPATGLSQVLLALRAGEQLADHANPGDATLQVLSGRVRLTAGQQGWDLTEGNTILIPHERHAVHADLDSVVLLTVVRHAARSGDR
jgi:quercetin dioxygenase-like cupin family protein